MTKVNKKKKHRKGLIALLVILIILLALAIGALYLLNRVNTVKLNMDNVAVNTFHDKNIDNYTNIAIFGVDSRESDLTSATRSDTIIICSINKKTKEVKLSSVYRDTLVKINDSYSKINAAYAKGSYELALTTLNTHFDLNLKDFVTVDFSAVANIVDKVGGVEIKIESDEIKALNKNIKDCNKLLKTESPEIKKAGTYTLDGTQALAYARIRKTAGNDFRRTERQRTVIKAILTKAKDTSVVSLVGIVNDMLPQVATSYNLADLLMLAKDVNSYKIVDQAGFPSKYRDAYVNKAAVLIPNTLSSNVTELHSFLFGTKDYEPSETVETLSNKLKQF
ncbi:MAG: LCP family protein [bacterium]|nr:LCP family protein [bacterium]